MGPSQTTQYQQHVGLRIEGSHPFLQRHSCQRKAKLAKAKKGRSRDLWGKFLIVIVSLFTFLLYYTQPPMYSLFVLARKCLTRKKLYIKRRKNKFFLWGSCCKWRLEYRTLEYQTFWSSVYQWSKIDGCHVCLFCFPMIWTIGKPNFWLIWYIKIPNFLLI